jgi:hypothetical protein
VTYSIPISRVTFDGVPFNINPLSCDIAQSIGDHEQITLNMEPVRGLSLSDGAYKTLSFAWDSDSSGRFYGYVVEYTVGPRRNTPGTLITVTAMGPTMVMKTGKPRFFTNATVADVVARVSAEAQLGFVDEFGRDHYIWPQLAQTDESDWEFVNDLATRVGSQILCTEGVLRLIDPQNVLSRSEPVMLLTNGQEQTSRPSVGVFEYNATSYSNRLPRSYAPTVSFLNSGVPQTVSGTVGKYSFQQYFSASVPVRNQAEAELAQITLPVDWEQQAQIRVSGSAKLNPGAVVYVRGGDKAARNEPYDGFWYITEAQHSLAKLVYQTTLRLARLAVTSRQVGIPAKNWWLDQRGRPMLTLNNVGNWISTWR